MVATARGLAWTPKLYPASKLAAPPGLEEHVSSVFGAKTSYQTRSVNASVAAPLPPPGLEAGAESFWACTATDINTDLPIPPPPPLPVRRGRFAKKSSQREADSVSTTQQMSKTPAKTASLDRTVRVSRLPNEILNHAMMIVTLEQAGIDAHVDSISIVPGHSRGQAIIVFNSTDAALRCVQHFHGRPWDASGVPVAAQLLSTEANICRSIECEDLREDPALDDMQILANYEARIDLEDGWDTRNAETFGFNASDDVNVFDGYLGADVSNLSSAAIALGICGMSAHAAEFVPWPCSMSPDAAEFIPAASFVPVKMSAEAIEFIPGKMPENVFQGSMLPETDLSTEDGESASSSDERDGIMSPCPYEFQ